MNTRGIGLGLHICRKIVRELGGDITCKSTWGEGSAFTFVVKLEPQDSDSNNEMEVERVANPFRMRQFPTINVEEEILLQDADYSSSDALESENEVI